MTFSILVTGAHNLGHIAVIRSLGLAGYHVVACSEEPDALGFYSSYTSYYLQNPEYSESTAFIAWLDETLTKYRIKIIIPTETFMMAIKDHFDDYKALLPYPVDKDLIYNLFSKHYLFNYFINKQSSPDVKKNIPKCYFLNSEMNESKIRSEILKASFPLYLKCDTLYSVNSENLMGNKVLKLETLEEALLKISAMKLNYKFLLLQEEADGIGVGVFFLRWKGKIIRYFMHQRLHEVPYTGGVSSYRRSWWHEKIYLDAMKKLDSLNYSGVIMFEYRWSKETDKFYLLEINSRFWGSLHLALFAGADFPKDLVSCMRGVQDYEGIPPKFPINVRCRHTIPWELQHVYSKLKDKSLTLKIKIKAVLEFFYLMLNWKVHSDLAFKKDYYLYWINLKRFISRL